MPNAKLENPRAPACFAPLHQAGWRKTIAPRKFKPSLRTIAAIDAQPSPPLPFAAICRGTFLRPRCANMFSSSIASRRVQTGRLWSVVLLAATTAVSSALVASASARADWPGESLFVTPPAVGTPEWWKKHVDDRVFEPGKGYTVPGVDGYFDGNGRPMNRPGAAPASAALPTPSRLPSRTRKKTKPKRA